MQKVITINLNGNAYQLDERGYDAMRAYLEQAERQLAGNPDQAEILADLEQAIADKCVRVLGAHKTVVSAAEVEQILKEMGPVEGGPATASTGGSGSSASGGPSTGTSADGQRARSAGGAAPRRLYLIRDGAMIAGVCSGIAAYLGMDVTIVRIVFMVFAVLTRGFGVLVYAVLMFVIPSANTSEERAAAHGEPFNAQELVDRAKQNYARFRNANWRRGADWRERWRGWRQERRQARRQRARYAAATTPPWWTPAAAVAPAGYVTRLLAGIMIPVFSAVNAAAFWMFAYVFMSLLLRQEVFGEELPPDMPLWVGLLIASVAYVAVTIPVHAARRASYYAVGGYHYGLVAAWDGLLSLGFGVLIVWLGYTFVPEVRELVQSLPFVWDSMREITRQP